ncbi:MAG: DMT family transporter [Roseitalea porphyridii]|uniref:DMT family transporter n=1 Tax=Roseitalea porphyridii TaxID=1852022 RepID=UPI0032EF0C5A
MPMSDKAAPSVPFSPAVARLLLVAVVILWGANWPVMKVGLLSMPPVWFAAARMMLGAASLLALLAVLGRLKLPTRRDLPVIFTVGALQMATFLVLVNFALQHVEAGRSAILAYTTPLWVTPAAVVLLGETLNRRKLLGLALGLGGVAVLFNPLGFDWASREALVGNAFLLAAALAGSVAILHVRVHNWDSSPLQLAPWQMLLAIPPLVALSWFTEDWAAVRWSGELALILAYNGPLATAFCFWATVSVTRALPAITSSLSLLGVPVAGVLASAIFLAEPLTSTLIGGLVLILFGTVLVNLGDVRRERANRPPAAGN